MRTLILRFPPTRGAAFWTFCVAFAFCFGAAFAGAAAFLAARVACFFSLTALAASSRIAFLRSSFWFFLAKISLREAPTMALWNLWVLLVLLLVVSSSIPFLCLRLYNTVHVTLRGLRRRPPRGGPRGGFRLVVMLRAETT